MPGAVYVYLPEDPAETLAEFMTEEGFGSVPIVDYDQRLVGIVSEFDLLHAIKEKKSLSGVRAAEMMTPAPFTVRP